MKKISRINNNLSWKNNTDFEIADLYFQLFDI